MLYLIKNATIINENSSTVSDVLVKGQRIEKVAKQISEPNAIIVDAEGMWLMPGIIDDQVHFREPGLTHKANIFTESCAAVAGGVTSFMEMPNTVPSAVSKLLLEDKYAIAARSSPANYSFFMGTTNSNVDEVLAVDVENVCGIKIFMGSSTGDMLVDNRDTLEKIFSEASTIIAIHSEDDKMVKANAAYWKEKLGEDNLTAAHHPIIRDEKACFAMTDFAVGLAKKHGTFLHVLHISTLEELVFFENKLPLLQKKITAEACVHHLYFDSEDYAKYGNLIKCNPAIKDKRHKFEILNAVLDDRIDIIATDHAPHTWEEKSKPYFQAPSGVPLVQHTLNIMLDFYHQGKITKEKMVEKMCHAPADLFRIVDRGYIREGYFADLVLVDPEKTWTTDKSNIMYKCGWSPFEGHTWKGSVEKTWVSGSLAFEEGKVIQGTHGMRMQFKRR